MPLSADNPVLLGLRDRLLDMGQPSLVPGVVPEAPDPSLTASLVRVSPFAELMFLIMVADREATESERAALRGAFRALTGGGVSTRLLDSLLTDFDHGLRVEGREARLEHVCAQLALDRQDAEGAYKLAVAMSVADGQLNFEEKALLEQVARWLGLNEARISALFDAARG